MALFTDSKPDWSSPKVATGQHSAHDQVRRIHTALGLRGNEIPRVDEANLYRYYQYLVANLTLPFIAYFPEPTSSRDEEEFRCTVLELLDPTRHLGDVCDGLFCRTRKGDYEVNLPLIDLYTPDATHNAQLVEDYWYWFWNWR